MTDLVPYGIELHTLLELVSASLMFFIAFLAWQRYRQIRSGFNLLWLVGFGLSGLEDTLHAIWPLISPEFRPFWLPFTWATTRFTLGLFLLLAVLWARRSIPERAIIPIVGVGALFSALLLLPIIGRDFDFVYQADNIIKRPLDAALMVGWGLLLVAFLRVPLARVQAPHGVHYFILLGVLSHFIVTFFSKSSLDGPFLAAHGVQVAEYGIWAGAAWWELHA